MRETLMRMIDEAAAAYVERECEWLPRDRRGRWGVIEPGAGRYLKGSPARVRQVADRASRRRARRFSSLSRARAFAREVGGDVFRWRRTPPGGGAWGRESPWRRALETADAARRLSTTLLSMTPREGEP